jgi:hypothetical protein
VLVVAFDAAMPEPMHSKRPMTGAFGAALVLDQPGVKGAICDVDFEPAEEDADWSAVRNTALNSLSVGNPAARSLILFEPIALGEPGTVSIACAPGTVYEWSVRPC